MSLFPCGTPMNEKQMCPIHGAPWACEAWMKSKRVVEPDVEEAPSTLATGEKRGRK